MKTIHLSRNGINRKGKPGYKFAKNFFILIVILFLSPHTKTHSQEGLNPTAPPIPLDQDFRFEHLTTDDGLSEGRAWEITQDTAPHTNLDPGQYPVNMPGSNYGGLWYEEGKSSHPLSTSPWWESWWFRIIELLLVIAGLSGLYYWRMQSLERRSLRLEKEVDLRTNELGELNKALQTELSERKKLADALRESEARLELAVQGIGGGIWYFNLNPEDPTQRPDEIYLSQNLKGLLGYQDHELANTLEAWEALIIPEDLEKMRELSMAYRLGKIKEYHHQYRARHKDGSIRWLQTHGRVKNDPDGRPLQFVGIEWDITDRKQQIDLLSESETKFRNLAENSPNMIFINAEGRLVFVNQKSEDVLGYTREEFYSPDFDFMSLIGPNSLELIQEKFQKHLNGEDVEPYEYRLVTRDGREIDVINTPKLIQFEGMQAILGVVTEITQQKELESLLRRYTDLLGERVKELNCLYSISRIAGKQELSLDDILQEIVELIPPSWQHPGYTGARITLDEDVYQTKNYQESAWQQTADIIVHREIAGQVEVNYIGKEPDKSQNPFSEEELDLLNAIAERLGRIVERIQTEQILKISQERYARAQQAAHIGSWDWDMVSDELFWSREIEPMFGFEPGEFGRTYQAFLDCVHPDDLDLVTESINASIGTKSNYNIEHRIIWPDGSVHWIVETGDIICDENDQPIRMVGVAQDISDRKWIENELRASEEEYRNIVENISDLIYAIDSQGIVTFVSPAIHTILGYRPEELLGQPFSHFILPDDMEEVEGNFALLVAGDTTGPNEYRLLTNSGEERWVRGTSQPIISDGRVIGAQGVITDITERKRSEEQREQAILAGERERLARELHDSVTQTLYTTSLIAETVPMVWESQPEEARKSLKELRLLTQSALTEMRALLVELRPDAILDRSLSELLNQLTTGVAARGNIHITTTITDEQPLPAAVQVALYRIAQEALNNISKHAQAELAWVTLRFDQNGVILRVKDNGRGYNSDQTLPHQMGLEIMCDRAEGIGADLTIDSQRGKGTEIKVELIQEEQIVE